MKKTKSHKGEYLRQLFHIALGIFFLLIFALFGRETLLLSLFLASLFALVVVHLKSRGFPLPALDFFLQTLERKSAPAVGSGALWYLMGMLACASVLESGLAIACSLWILAVGDGISTMIGKRFGTHALPYNNEKTAEGTLAFCLACLPLLPISPNFFLIGAICALLEGMKIELFGVKIDDNLMLGIACAALFMLAA